MIILNIPIMVPIAMDPRPLALFPESLSYCFCLNGFGPYLVDVVPVWSRLKFHLLINKCFFVVLAVH